MDLVGQDKGLSFSFRSEKASKDLTYGRDVMSFIFNRHFSLK